MTQQNIIIKEISEDKISLNINGEMREIQNTQKELDNLSSYDFTLSNFHIKKVVK